MMFLRTTKNTKYKKYLNAGGLVAALFSLSLSAAEQKASPITLAEQGNFATGGTVVKSDGVFDGKKLFDAQGQTLHGDHAAVSYQIPVKARQYPMVFLHGAGQSALTWGTTPDGREGFQTRYLRQGYGVYLVDQPRRGRAGQSTVPAELTAATNDQLWFNMFRLGQWPSLFYKVQFSEDPAALEQFFRQMTPNTGPFDEQLIGDAMAAVFQRSGPGLLITHSQGGGPGWWTAIKTERVRGIVSYEPGSGFVFPEGEVPEPMQSGTGALAATAISMQDFKKLTRIPIVIYYGDNIPTESSANPGQDNWRVRLKMAQLWVDKINQHGGKAKVVHLPAVGIHGNTHFPFSDLNSEQVALQLDQWLAENKLDRIN